MQHNQLERAFCYADKENNGFLNKHEIKVAYLTIFGYKPSQFEMNDIFTKYGNNECIDKANFINFVLDRQKYIDKYDQIRETFQCFDTRRKGFINFEDFKKGMQKHYMYMPELKITQYFRELDLNGDGKVSFYDFTIMMEEEQSLFLKK